MKEIIIAGIVASSLVLMVTVICLSILAANDKIRFLRTREHKSVQQARDSLAKTRLRAEEDLIQLAQNRILDQTRDGQKELPVHAVEHELRIIRGR